MARPRRAQSAKFVSTKNCRLQRNAAAAHANRRHAPQHAPPDPHIDQEARVNNGRGPRVAAAAPPACPRWIRRHHHRERKQISPEPRNPRSREQARSAKRRDIGRMRHQTPQSAEQRESKSERPRFRLILHNRLPMVTPETPPDSAPTSISATPSRWLAQRLQTNSASLSRFRYFKPASSTLPARASATQTRSARRQMVRQTCSSALSRDRPAERTIAAAASPSFMRSISRSSCSLSAAVMRACFGCTSSGSVARIEPRLNSSCCTRQQNVGQLRQLARRFAREPDEAVQFVHRAIGLDAEIVLRQRAARPRDWSDRHRRAAYRRG